MSEGAVPFPEPPRGEEDVSLRLGQEVGILAGRLARLLENLPSVQRGDTADHRFLLAHYEATTGGGPLSRWREAPSRRSPRPATLHPLDRLFEALEAAPAEEELFVLAAMPEEHEGLGNVLSTLHPSGEGRATVGLAAQLLDPSPEGRRELRRVLEEGALVRSGALAVQGSGPYFSRSLVLADALWSALHGLDAWPEGIRPDGTPPGTRGLEEWLETVPVEEAREALAGSLPWTILLSDRDPTRATERAAALVEASGRTSVRTRLPDDASRSTEHLVGLHTLLRGAVPVVQLEGGRTPASPRRGLLPRHPGPVVVCAEPGRFTPEAARPFLELREEEISPTARLRMWRGLLPELEDDAPALASSLRLEPTVASSVARDARGKAKLAGRALKAADVRDSARSRTSATIVEGVTLRTPAATWDDLVLPESAAAQLREAAGRNRHQAQVLDAWGFLRNRPGARGVRLLLTGPPGTGKSLSAEVLAGDLGVDLMVADVSRLVSKWIGETEKNLARIFDAAEAAQVVLLFDEADALFARRTEVSDSNSRYANMETAYLLSRLERFQGAAVLSTNLRRNLDQAFVRRLDFIVEYREPGVKERSAIWGRHVPAAAPLGPDVDLAELSRIYPLSGGQIRNAAVGAAFQAASRGEPIDRELLVRSICREYEKAGRPFPGTPPDLD